MDLSKFLDLVKLPTRIIGAFSVVLAILVFSSDATLINFGLQTFVAQHRPYLAVGFLVTLALSLVNLVSGAWKAIYPWICEAHWIKVGKKRLNTLTPKEKEILLYYIRNQTRSQTLRIQDGTVNCLQKENIIIRASGLGTVYGFDFVIQPWAWEYLSKNPGLLNESHESD